MALTSSHPAVAFLVASALALVTAACGNNYTRNKVTADTTGPGQQVNLGDDVLTAFLSGTEEVPGPGVKDGVGTVTLDFGGEQACYDFKVTMGEYPAQAHIHEGTKGASGGVVVNLNPKFRQGEAAFLAQGCSSVRKDDADRIMAAPAGFYVNIHTDAHPDGAVRGQLTAD